MKWSKLRQEVEAFVTPKMAGRVRLMSTRYRRAHDEEGRWALLLDDVEVGGIGCIPADREEWQLAESMKGPGITAKEAWSRGAQALQGRAHHTQTRFYEAVWSYTQLPIRDALASPDALVRSLAYLDRRTGRRRLIALSGPRPQTELEVACLSARLSVEGIPHAWIIESAAQQRVAPDRARRSGRLSSTPAGR